jgi:tetratricopeptide (TPR) repeat protein
VEPDDQKTPDSGSQVRPLLDEAARAYMSGDYDAAVAAWQSVLEADPSNPRAREGIKKVSMLQAEERGQDDPSADPAVEEIQGLLQKRRFEEAARACREHAETAGPALLSALRKLQDRADRARAVEPEIQRCMLDARRCLQEGEVREAIPHLKQVLVLDRTHPVALRLMNGIRERVRKRMEAPSGPADESLSQQLPASGAPGSDASPTGSPVSTQPPAPPGRGLPSSPAGRDVEQAVPEIELEIDPAFADPGAALDEGTTDQGADEDVVAETPMEIDLESAPEAETQRAARGGFEPEAPFAADEEEEEEKEEETHETPPAAGVPATAAGVSEEKEPPRPGGIADGELESLTQNIGSSLPPPPPQPAKVARKRGRGRLVGVPLLAAAVAGIAALGAAWWFGIIPGLAPPRARPLEVARPAPPERPGELAAPEAGSQAASAPSRHGAPTTAGGENDPASGPAHETRQRLDPQAALALFEKGQDQFETGQFEKAAETFRQALALDPVNPDIAVWQAKADDQLRATRRLRAEQDTAAEAFASKDFETALRKFYRLEEKDPDGPYQTYIANSWYNWGLQFLAAGNLQEADRKMDEVLGIRPDDQEAAAIKELIAEYSNRPKDRIFFLRIEALRYRPLDA